MARVFLTPLTASASVTLSDTGGTSAGGLTFGTDTNLYRIAADRLATDDAFSTATNLTVGSTGTSGGFRLRVIGSDVNGLRMDNTGASGSGSGAGIQAINNDGAAMASGDRLGFFVFGGAYDGASSTHNGAGFNAFTSEAWSSTNRGSEMRIEVTPNGTASRAVALTIGNDKSLTLADTGNIAVGTSTGTKIGTATSQKLGFYNATPIVQPSTTTPGKAMSDLGLVATPYAPAWEAASQGFISWNIDPAYCTTSSALTTAGTMYVQKLNLPVARTITNLYTYVLTAGATLTAGQCFAALYQNGTLLGTTASQSTAWAGTGLMTMAISGGAVAVAAGDIYVALWFNGTTGPSIIRAASQLSATAGLVATASRWGTADTGRTTTAPTPLGTISAQSNTYWVAVG